MNTLSSLLNFTGNEIITARSHLQVGEIKAFAGGTVPSKWKLCDGSVISRSGYADLFTAIGTTWGGGDGSTTFAIPDLRGRTAVGAGESSATGHTAHTLGQMSGEEKHTLTVSEMPAHQHNGYTIGMYTPTSGGIAYPLYSHVSGTWSQSNATQNTGGGQAHNIMQPYSTVNYIIYTGVA